MAFQCLRRRLKRLRGALAVLLSIQLGAPALAAQSPEGGVVRAGSAQISTNGSTTTISQSSSRAIIDWRTFGVGADAQVVFAQPSATSATLNRVTGDQASVILGRLDANGQVFLINPNGIVFGGGAQINVGSLIASTSNISNTNFMTGQLIFDQPGRPGAGILNAGAMTAAEGGLIALVAPHVRNDGLIQAKLGKVLLGAADTFTVDLYGDGLINLALSDANTGQLRELDGTPVTSLITQAGTIDTAGGHAVLLTASNAKNVLDNLINMSGTIKADTAVAQGGQILLLGEGGKVDVSGALSARGATGGAVQVLGDQLHLASTAALDASGVTDGGVVHVGGAYHGQGDTYRASQTTVDSGATLAANAGDQGNGGEVVVWSTGVTNFFGSVQALGGASAGNGGRLEVSGKGSLNFFGEASAMAPHGQSGSLLLDPAFLNIGPTEASVIERVLRTGTSTDLVADNDITVSSPITGGDRAAGGGLTMTAGNNINVNDFIVTNNGAINLFATKGTINIAPGKALFAGTAPIAINAGGTIHTGSLFTGGALTIASTAGSVDIDTPIDSHTGPVNLQAAADVDINQPIANLTNGAPLTVTAGNDINVNVQIDGRGGATGGAVAMTANHDVNVNDPIVTNNGSITLDSANAAISVAQGSAIVAGTAAISMSARGDVSTGAFSGGSLTIASTAGSVAINGLVDSATSAASISAANDVDINQPIFNGQTGGALTVNAGRDVNVNALVDGLGGASGGAITLVAGRNLNANQSLATNNGAITLSATSGTATVSAGQGLFSGSAPIRLSSAGDLTMGAVSGGSLSATSSAGSLAVNGVIDGAAGAVTLHAGQDVLINQPVLSPSGGGTLTVTAGHDIAVNAPIDGLGGPAGGGVTLTAANNVGINNSVVTNVGAIAVTATGGAVSTSAGAVLVSGQAPVAISAAGDVTTAGISGGSFSATSTTGSVNINGVIDGTTGRVDLTAGADVNINQPVLNLTSGLPFDATAGRDVNVNAPIDGSAAAGTSGAATLTAGNNVNVNAPVLTHNAAISATATDGAATIASTAGLYAGTGAISVNALGDVTTTGALSGGAMTIQSRGASVTVNQEIAGNGGAIAIVAANTVDVEQAITNPGASSPLTISAGNNITLNGQIDGRTVAGASGAVTLTAVNNVTLNKGIDTQDGAITITATDGAVTEAANQGLFAGSGAITVQSAATLTNGITSTTGPLTFRSTAGSVNIDTAISGNSGPETIQAAGDVNINAGISNKQTGAALSVSAGHDINVNSAIDGTDALLTGSSGTVSMTAANDVNLNQNIETRNSAISLTAQNGSIAWANGIGLFAGNGAISTTSGQSLTPGITSTTGALNFTSTLGSVTIGTAIGDTTGAVTIKAATDVDLNQPISNLKSGANLFVAAGHDINLNSSVDGRSGATAGGTVTMTAGNNLTIADNQFIATNNGAIGLTATAGSVVMPLPACCVLTPMQWTISAGNAPVSVTSGSDFTLLSPIVTTGSLAITSTTGDVTIDAPITDQTGAVTITAGNGLIVNHDVKSNNQPITLNAGAGGITINTINDFDQTMTSPVSSKSADLTLNSVGNVSILDSRGIASSGTLTIDTRGQILTGSIGNASTGRPESLILNADGGIVSFDAGFAHSIVATSSGGSITLNVDAPDKLRITTGTPNTLDCPTCDITLRSDDPATSSIGPDVVLNAGGSVNLAPVTSGNLTLIARNFDINFGLGARTNVGMLTATAGRDVNLVDILTSGGDVTLTAGRDINTTANSPIQLENSQSLTLTAGQDVTLNELFVLGAVNITATNGNVTLNNDIGPHMTGYTGTGPSVFDPNDLGVGSLSISAPASTAAITMQGARAEGDVTISTGGSLTAAKQITSVNGTVTITTGGAETLSNVPIGSQADLPPLATVSPITSPGPKAPLPTAPGLISDANAGLPALSQINVAPSDQIVAGVVTPGGATGNVGKLGQPGDANGPGASGGFTEVSAFTPVSVTADASSSSESGSSTDSAAALRAAQAACGPAKSNGDATGLSAATGAKSSESGSSGGPTGCSAKAAAQTAPDTAPADSSAPAATGAEAMRLPSGGQDTGGAR